MCRFAKFPAKQTTLTFSVQICPAMDLGLEIQKTNVGIRISIVKMPCMPIFRKNQQLWLFNNNLCKNGFWGWNFKTLSPESESASLEYYVHQFSDKTNNFEFWVQICPKIDFGVRTSKT